MDTRHCLRFFRRRRGEEDRVQPRGDRAGEIVHGIIAHVQNLVWRQADDLTLLLVRYRDPNSADNTDTAIPPPASSEAA